MTRMTMDHGCTLVDTDTVDCRQFESYSNSHSRQSPALTPLSHHSNSRVQACTVASWRLLPAQCPVDLMLANLVPGDRLQTPGASD